MSDIFEIHYRLYQELSVHRSYGREMNGVILQQAVWTSVRPSVRPSTAAVGRIISTSGYRATKAINLTTIDTSGRSRPKRTTSNIVTSTSMVDNVTSLRAKARINSKAPLNSRRLQELKGWLAF